MTTETRRGPTTSEDHMDLVERYSAHNYHPLPVVVAEAAGAYVTDVEGKRYLDMLAAYSAINFGHRHPALIQAAKDELDRVTLTGRAFHNDQFGPFCRDLAELTGKDMVLPMNSGAEGVETALKTARMWGYRSKGISEDGAKIITCSDNFHGRTISIIGFSTDPDARKDFGPFTPGFETVEYGNIEALEAAIDDHTAAFLVEPIQGEAGVKVPPKGYLKAVREICTRNDVLMIADEIQSGLGRTGFTFACEHDAVVPDIYILGKALGGGIMPVSAVAADQDILGLFKPGEHGSTFGGNPVACAIGRKVIELLNTGEFQRNSAELGTWLLNTLHEQAPDTVAEVRGRGLWVGIQLQPGCKPAREVCERLMNEGVLCKDTHETTIRLAPPLVVTRADLQWALDRIIPALANARV